MGCEILNGNKEGHEDREWTYIGTRGESILNYGIANEDANGEARLQSVEKSKYMNGKDILWNYWEIRDSKITEDEIERQIERLKKGKTRGGDGIQNQVWMFGTEVVKERIWEVVDGVWKGKGFPRQWREGIIIPLFKKGQKSNVKNYRGIKLLNTAYKIYAMILDERLRKGMEAMGILPDGQAGFKKGRDFKAAFDSVNREKMWEYLRRKGADAYLVTKTEEIYEETVNKVRVNRIGNETYPGDIEEIFRKAQTGGVVVDKKKVWSLAYADDLVIVSKKREEMKTMIKSFV
ncbi:uncharacterized protein LOC135129875 [Zophobas morio]|uniref:uncharacterized protein LOC135129875 n=1 Tax=Zophobas morio TaxID=2755281 RepID=UPI00308396AF